MTKTDWLTMESAPTDGTIVEVVGRYLDATAGHPRFAGFYNGQWYELSRFPPQSLVCWAWRPRTSWPSEDWTYHIDPALRAAMTEAA